MALSEPNCLGLVSTQTIQSRNELLTEHIFLLLSFPSRIRMRFEFEWDSRVHGQHLVSHLPH